MKRDIRLIVRFAVSIVFFLLIFLGVVWRAFNLATWDPYALKNKQQALIHKKIIHKAPRGEFFDRYHYPLAMNVPRYRVYLDLGRVVLTEKEKRSLKSLLLLDATMVDRLLTKNVGKYFLLDQVDYTARMQLMASGIPGLHYEELLTRYYPLGFSSAQLLGRMDREGVGVEGLEKLYQNHLIGQDGEHSVRQDRLGQAIELSKASAQMEIGQSIVLTLDHRIQQFAYKELLAQLEESEAKAGAVVVLNHKGDIVAMVSAPSYDPNQRIEKLDGRMTNRGVVDVFEPGSTIKPIAFAALLPHIRPTTMIDTEGGRYRLGRFVIKDVRDYGRLSLTDVMVHSSNVAMIKLSKAVGSDVLLKTYQAFKLFEPTYAGLLGEHVTLNGAMIKPGSIGYYALSYGYGMQVSLLQLAHAYLILANRGMDPGLHLLSDDHRARPEYQRVASKDTIDQLTKMMVASVELGTGKLAQVPGVAIAGKTGTSQISVSGKYTEKKHVTTFVGFGPADQDALESSRFTIAVVIFEPKVGKHFGGMAAAPLFAKIMHYALSIDKNDESRLQKWR